MEVEAGLLAPVEPDVLFDAVRSLDNYPAWLDIVRRVEGAGADAWLVDLGGRIGPLVRTKRLRMVRTTAVAPTPASHGTLRFERQEVDGRPHSDWMLDATVSAEPDGSLLTMRLHYGGTLFVPLIDRLLREEIRSSRTRLLAHLRAVA